METAFQTPIPLSSMTLNVPHFDDIQPRSVTTVIDDAAILRCRVKNKGNRTVSWIRKRDLHILTTNIYTYTGDQRFSIHHPTNSDDWNLRISYAQPSDTGVYECQINTEPKQMRSINLEVTSAKANIIGEADIYVKFGSTISLTCVINVHVSQVIWYHNMNQIDFDSTRGGISLETEKTEYGTSSRLMLTRAKQHDNGNYTCAPLGVLADSICVHVLNGEHPAAMQTSGKRGIPVEITRHIFLLSFQFMLILDLR